ncbi:MAG: right-handed parallel beta-helix repeat-containing protein [Blastocatellales bacterium]
MMHLIIRLLCSFALIGFGGEVLAATYYVAVNGNNNNPGTSTQPWATLQKAVDAVVAGDVIIVQAGTYAGCRIGKSGTANSPITLKAEPGARPLINQLAATNRHQSLIEVENFDARVSYWIIDGFEISGAPRHGVDIRNADFITVQNCYSHNNGSTSVRGDGIFLGFAEHPTLQFNELSFNSEHGLYHSNSADYPTIRGNRLHHNANAGIHINGDLSQGGDGIISFGLIEKNVIWENGTGGGSGINCDGLSDSIIRNNLLYANHASGISLYAIDAAAGASRNQVLHNTIIQASNGRYCLNIPAADGVVSPTGNVVKNNIFIHTGTRGSIVTYSASALQSDYNIVVNRFSQNDGDTIITLAAWQTAGQDQHSIVSAPDTLFADVAGNNYRLKSGSPAINAGTNAGVSEDADGVPRPQGSAPDIGCYETASSSAAHVSAASYKGAALAPESIIAAFGGNLATATLSATTVPLPTTLAGTNVKIRDAMGTERPAPLFFVSPTQINYQIPAGTINGTAAIVIASSNGQASQTNVQIARVAPALFTANASGQGVAAAYALRIKANGSQISEPIAQFDQAQSRFVVRPIDLGDASDQVYVILFGSGLRFRSSLTAVSAQVGGTPATVTYVGVQGEFVGLDQANVLLPRSLIGRGEVDVVLTIDGQAANTVRISIK